MKSRRGAFVSVRPGCVERGHHVDVPPREPRSSHPPKRSRVSPVSTPDPSVPAAVVPSLVELIARKRDGGSLSKAEIGRMVSCFTSGELADYQMSAFLMAVLLRGMTDDETVGLTEAMLRSGDVLDLGSIPGPKVDKHSTGGVGDKVSICLAPMVAACGVYVPMVSGRGLGHTGGTLDKLEAIPGFSVNLPTSDFVRIVRDVGMCLIGQTARIVPADKRMYALRDVTATVESIPLIVASILSKKLAEGIDGLVLDVKVGRGAFMKSEADARRLATALVRVGTAAGKRVRALLTDMSAPLGRTIGNSLETREALLVLHGKGPADLVECTLALGAEMLRVGGVARTDAEARAALQRSIDSGEAAARMERLVAAQGGDASVVAHPERMPSAPLRVALRAGRSGVVRSIDALELGLVAVTMGAGRTRADQAVDPVVGIELACARGEHVKAGEPVAWLHVRDEPSAERVAARALAAFDVGDEAAPAPSLVMATIDGEGASG